MVSRLPRKVWLRELSRQVTGRASTMIGPHSWLPADRRAAYWRAYSISLFSAFTTGSLLYLFGFNEKEAIITSCGVSVAVFLTLIFLYQQETTSNTVLLAVSQWTRTRKSSFA